MTEWEKELGEKLSQYSEAEFNYIDTKDITRANDIDLGCSGVYMEATIIYLEIKNLPFILKEHGRRKAAKAYTMLHTVLASIAEKSSGAFVNDTSPSAIMVVYPGKEEVNQDAVKGAMRIVYALSDAFKHQFSGIGLEFSMGMDHGHIMGTKNVSDGSFETINWFGSCIYKAMRICRECARPFYIGISGSIYHNLDDSLRIAERRILGIKKKVEIWTKVTYQYENVKKHLYQSNHKISFDEE